MTQRTFTTRLLEAGHTPRSAWQEKPPDEVLQELTGVPPARVVCLVGYPKHGKTHLENILRTLRHPPYPIKVLGMSDPYIGPAVAYWNSLKDDKHHERWLHIMNGDIPDSHREFFDRCNVSVSELVASETAKEYARNHAVKAKDAFRKIITKVMYEARLPEYGGHAYAPALKTILEAVDHPQRIGAVGGLRTAADFAAQLDHLPQVEALFVHIDAEARVGISQDNWGATEHDFHFVLPRLEAHVRSRNEARWLEVPNNDTLEAFQDKVEKEALPVITAFLSGE